MELKDWLNSINFTKENLIEEDPDLIKEYPPFIINRCLSGHLDAIMFANEMNKYPNLDKDLQYHFYLNTCLLYTSPSPRDGLLSRMPSSA